MNFPASEREIQTVRNLMNLCEESIQNAGITLDGLHGYLDDNYLAIDSEYKRELDKEITVIESKMWALKIMLVKMRNNPERIIKKES